MYDAKNRIDLIIEVWEKLDCETVGAKEILAIEAAVRERFGPAAVDSPMIVARLLADEGAQLRHSEIMDLFVERQSGRPYESVVRKILKLSDLRSAEASIKNLENLRRKLNAEDDKEELRKVRETAIREKEKASAASLSKKASAAERSVQGEISEWLAHWLKTPELFDQWLALRKRSADFKETFGEINSGSN